MAISPTRSPHYVLAMLYLICMVSYVDRQILALLAPHIQRDLGLQDWQLGFVSGTAFALFYVVMSIPLSWLADRYNRVRMLAGCMVAWSVMTAACGMVTNFVQLSLARAGVATGEAGGYPTSLSLISDIYPPENRTTATAIFFSATTAGSLAALGLGGLIYELVGWRMTFVVAAGLGLVLTPILLLTVREPMRGQLDASAETGAQAPRESYRALFSRPLFAASALAGAIYGIQLFSLPAWAPTYALRTFEITTAQTGLGIGIASGLVGGAVMIVGGNIADRLARRNRAAPVYLAAAGQLLCAFAIWAAMYAPGFTLFCIFYATAFGAAGASGPMLLAATQIQISARTRGTAAALLVMIWTLVGYGLGPPLIGAISDLIGTASPAANLRGALLAGSAFSLIGCLILIVAARRHGRAVQGGDGLLRGI